MERTVFGFAAAHRGRQRARPRLSGLGVKTRASSSPRAPSAARAAGLAGMVEVAAVHGRANASLVAGYGYAGILVAFLARHNPLAIMPVALLLGGIGASGGLLQRAFGLPDATRERAAGHRCSWCCSASETLSAAASASCPACPSEGPRDGR